MGGLTVNQTNLCYFMQPYFGYDVVFNPMVWVMDRYGVVLINLAKNEVQQVQVYEDQAYYQNSYTSRNQNCGKGKQSTQDTTDTNQDKNVKEEKSISSDGSKAMNTNMW